MLTYSNILWIVYQKAASLCVGGEMNKDRGASGVEVSSDGKHPAVETIEDVITFRLNRLVAIGDRSAQLWSERLFDLSINEWRLLALVKSREPCRAGDISDLLLMDKSQTSRVIKVLHERDLLRSVPDERDRRAIILELTPAGVALYQDVFAEVIRSNERFLAVLSKSEVKALDGILNKLMVHSEDMLDDRFGRVFVR